MGSRTKTACGDIRTACYEVETTGYYFAPNRAARVVKILATIRALADELAEIDRAEWANEDDVTVRD